MQCLVRRGSDWDGAPPGLCPRRLGRTQNFESDSNGIKLSSNTLLYQNVTGFSTWFCEERVRLGPTFDGPWLDPVRSVGIDHQRGQGFPGTRRAGKRHSGQSRISLAG